MVLDEISAKQGLLEPHEAAGGVVLERDSFGGMGGIRPRFSKPRKLGTV